MYCALFSKQCIEKPTDKRDCFLCENVEKSKFEKNAQNARGMIFVAPLAKT
jgi:hypothetical protein